MQSSKINVAKIAEEIMGRLALGGGMVLIVHRNGDALNTAMRAHSDEGDELAMLAKANAAITDAVAHAVERRRASDTSPEATDPFAQYIDLSKKALVDAGLLPAEGAEGLD